MVQLPQKSARLGSKVFGSPQKPLCVPASLTCQNPLDYAPLQVPGYLQEIEKMRAADLL